jgi:hypothetical protein
VKRAKKTDRELRVQEGLAQLLAEHQVDQKPWTARTDIERRDLRRLADRFFRRLPGLFALVDARVT